MYNIPGTRTSTMLNLYNPESSLFTNLSINAQQNVSAIYTLYAFHIQQSNGTNSISYKNYGANTYYNSLGDNGSFYTGISEPNNWNNTNKSTTTITFAHTSTGTENFYYNGEQSATGTPSQTTGIATYSWTPYGTFIGAAGGANPNDRNGPLDGELYSLFVFVGSTLSDTQRNLVESYV